MHFLRRNLSRRTMLRGLGVAIGLPLLDAMLPVGCATPEPASPDHPDAGPQPDAGPRLNANGRPTRLVFFTVPNGFYGPSWTPADEGPAYALSPHLRGIEAHRNDLSVLSGLSNLLQEDGVAFHPRATASLLTCTAVNRNTLSGGVSVDQVAAARIGGTTLLPSLELGTSPPHSVALNCDGAWGCLWGDNIAWAGPQRPVPKDADPRSVFGRLFGVAAAEDTLASWQQRQSQQQSILDFALDDAHRIAGSLGAADRSRLDEYLTNVRAVELTIARQHAPTTPTSMRPGEDLAIPERLQVMFDLTVLALQADLTRVVTLMHGFGLYEYGYPNLGSGVNLLGHHNVSHYFSDAPRQAAQAMIGDWEIAQFASFVAKLKAVDDGGSSLLDNSLVMFASELLDGNYHRSNNLPVLLAGRAGGRVRTGFHRHYANDAPIANLYSTMLSAVGVSVPRFGTTGTGLLPGLLV